MATDQDSRMAMAARRTALVIAATAVFWVVASFLGSQLGLSNRTRALFDLIALAGFGYAMWMTYQVWRLRRTDKG